jgi:hypothetical protein
MMHPSDDTGRLQALRTFAAKQLADLDSNITHHDRSLARMRDVARGLRESIAALDAILAERGATRSREDA